MIDVPYAIRESILVGPPYGRILEFCQCQTHHNPFVKSNIVVRAPLGRVLEFYQWYTRHVLFVKRIF